jgi:hypothetical protein
VCFCSEMSQVVRIQLGGDLKYRPMGEANISEGAIVDYVKHSENILLMPRDTNIDSEVWIFETADLTDSASAKTFKHFFMYDETPGAKLVQFEVKFVGISAANFASPPEFSDSMHFLWRSTRTVKLEDGQLSVIVGNDVETFDMASIHWDSHSHHTKLNICSKGKNIISWSDSHAKETKVTDWLKKLEDHRLYASMKRQYFGVDHGQEEGSAALTVVDPGLKFSISRIQINDIPHTGMLLFAKNAVYVEFCHTASAKLWTTKHQEVDPGPVDWNDQVAIHQPNIVFEIPESKFREDPSFRMRVMSITTKSCIGECSLSFPSTMKRSVLNESIDCSLEILAENSTKVVSKGLISFKRGFDTLSGMAHRDPSVTLKGGSRDATDEVNHDILTEKVKVSGPAIKANENCESQFNIVHSISRVMYYLSAYGVNLREDHFLSEIDTEGNSTFIFKIPNIKHMGPVFPAIQVPGCRYYFKLLGHTFSMERQASITAASVVADLTENMDISNELPDCAERYALHLHSCVCLMEKAASMDALRLPLKDEAVREFLDSLETLGDADAELKSKVPLDNIRKLNTVFSGATSVLVSFDSLCTIVRLLQTLVVANRIENIERIPPWILSSNDKKSVDSRVDSLLSLFDYAFKSVREKHTFTNIVLLLLIHFEILKVYKQPCTHEEIEEAAVSLRKAVTSTERPIFAFVVPDLDDFEAKLGGRNYAELKLISRQILKVVRPVDMYQFQRSLNFSKGNTNFSSDLIMIDPLGREITGRTKVIDVTNMSPRSAEARTDAGHSKIKCVISRELNLPYNDTAFYSEMLSLGEFCYKIEFLDKATRARYFDHLVSNSDAYRFRTHFCQMENESVVYIISDEAAENLNAQFEITTSLISLYMKKLTQDHDENDIDVALYYWNELPGFAELSQFITNHETKVAAVKATFQGSLVNVWRKLVTDNVSTYVNPRNSAVDCSGVLKNIAKPIASMFAVEGLSKAVFGDKKSTPFRESLLELIRLQGRLQGQAVEVQSVGVVLQVVDKMRLLIDFFGQSSSDDDSDESNEDPVMGYMERFSAAAAEGVRESSEGLSLPEVLQAKLKETVSKVWEKLKRKGSAIVCEADIAECLRFRGEIQQYLDYLELANLFSTEIDMYQFCSEYDDQLLAAIQSKLSLFRSFFESLLAGYSGNSCQMDELIPTLRAVVEVNYNGINSCFQAFEDLEKQGLKAFENLYLGAVAVMAELQEVLVADFSNMSSKFVDTATFAVAHAAELVALDQFDLLHSAKVEDEKRVKIESYVKSCQLHITKIVHISCAEVTSQLQVYFGGTDSSDAAFDSLILHCDQLKIISSAMPGLEKVDFEIRPLTDKLLEIHNVTNESAKRVTIADTAESSSLFRHLLFLHRVAPHAPSKSGLLEMTKSLCMNFQKSCCDALKVLTAHANYPLSLSECKRASILINLCEPTWVDDDVFNMNKRVDLAVIAATLETGFKVSSAYQSIGVGQQFRIAANSDGGLSVFKEQLVDQISTARDFVSAGVGLESFKTQLFGGDAWSEVDKSVFLTIPNALLTKIRDELSLYWRDILSAITGQLKGYPAVLAFLGAPLLPGNSAELPVSALYAVRDKLQNALKILCVLGDEHFQKDLKTEFDMLLSQLSGTINTSMENVPEKILAAWSEGRFPDIVTILNSQVSVAGKKQSQDIFSDEVKKLNQQLIAECQRFNGDVNVDLSLKILRLASQLSKVLDVCSAHIDIVVQRQCSTVPATMVLTNESNLILKQLSAQLSSKDKSQIEKSLTLVSASASILEEIRKSITATENESGPAVNDFIEQLSKIANVLTQSVQLNDSVLSQVKAIGDEFAGLLGSAVTPGARYECLNKVKGVSINSFYGLLDASLQNELKSGFQVCVDALLRKECENVCMASAQATLQFTADLFDLVPADFKCAESFQLLQKLVAEEADRKGKFILQMGKSLKAIESQLDADNVEKQTAALRNFAVSWEHWKQEIEQQLASNQSSETVASIKNICKRIQAIVSQLESKLIDEKSDKVFVANLSKSLPLLTELKAIDVVGTNADSTLDRIFPDRSELAQLGCSVASKSDAIQRELCAKVQKSVQRFDVEQFDSQGALSLCSKVADAISLSRQLHGLMLEAPGVFGAQSAPAGNSSRASDGLDFNSKSPADTELYSLMTSWVKIDLTEEYLRSFTDNEVINIFKKFVLQLNVVYALAPSADYLGSFIGQLYGQVEVAVRLLSDKAVGLLGSRSSTESVESLSESPKINGTAKALSDLEFSQVSRYMFYLGTMAAVFTKDESWWVGLFVPPSLPNFKELGDQVNQTMAGGITDLFVEYLTKVEVFATGLVNKYKVTEDASLAFNLTESIANVLLELWFLSETYLNSFSQQVLNTITSICSKIQQLKSSKRVLELYELLTQTDGGSRSGIGLSLVRRLPLFAKYNLRQENKIRNATTEDQLFEHLKLVRGEGFNEAKKKEQYREHLHEFYQKWMDMVQRGKREMVSVFGELIHNVHFSVYQLLQQQHINDEEAFAVVRGIITNVFVMWTLLYSPFDKVDPEAEEESDLDYLVKPHRGQVLSLLLLFDGIHVQVIDGRVSAKVSNHFVQIGTGEGKSVTLAVAALVFALLGMFVDCSCYSSHLCTRDYNAFKKLFEAFGVENFICYQTFNKQCENFIKQKLQGFGGMKVVINEILTKGIIPTSHYQTNTIAAYEKVFGQTSTAKSKLKRATHTLIAERRRSLKLEESGGSAGAGAGAGAGGSILDAFDRFAVVVENVKKLNAFRKYMQTMNRHRILLMDEADMFFADSFYGSTLPISISVESVSFARLLVKIWFDERLKSAEDVIASSEFKNLEFPACWHSLLQQSAYAMIRDRDAVRESSCLAYEWHETSMNVRYKGADGAYTDSLIIK